MTVAIPADTLRAVFKALATQVETVKIRPAEDGWHLYGRSLDSVSIVDAHIRTEAFTEYEQWNDIVVDTKDILEPISKAQDDVKLNVVDNARLDIKAGRLNFRRPLIAELEVNPRFPELDLDVECIVSVDVLGEILGAPVGDMRFKALRLSQTPEALTLKVFEDDDEMSTVTCAIASTDCVMLEGEGSARYPARCWSELVRCIPKGTDVDLLFKHNFPMMMSYTVGNADIRMMIAPHIEEE